MPRQPPITGQRKIFPFITRAFFCARLRMGARRGGNPALARTACRGGGTERGKRGTRGARSRGLVGTREDRQRRNSDAEVRWAEVKIIYAASRARNTHAQAYIYAYAETYSIIYIRTHRYIPRNTRAARLHVTLYGRSSSRSVDGDTCDCEKDEKDLPGENVRNSPPRVKIPSDKKLDNAIRLQENGSW